jgi:hypothetical protein
MGTKVPSDTKEWEKAAADAGLLYSVSLPTVFRQWYVAKRAFWQAVDTGPLDKTVADEAIEQEQKIGDAVRKFKECVEALKAYEGALEACTPFYDAQLKALAQKPGGT